MLLLLLHAVEGNSLIANCSALCTDDSATYQPDDGSASVTRVSMMSSLPYAAYYNSSWHSAACRVGCGIWGAEALPYDPTHTTGLQITRPSAFEPRLARCNWMCSQREVNYGIPAAWAWAQYAPEILAPVAFPPNCEMDACAELPDTVASLAACRSGCALAERLSCHPGRYRQIGGLSFGGGAASPPPGVVTNLAQQLCFDCPVGRAQPGYGADGCELCPSGRFANEPGSARCRVCPLGSNTMGITGSSNCTVTDGCGVGNYTALDGECAICPAGNYCPDPRRATVIACGSTNYCPRGSFASTARSDVEDGMYLTAAFPPVAMLCEIGHSCARGNLYACPVGKYAPVQGLRGYNGAGCLNCPAGRMHAAGTLVGQFRCIECLQGYRCVGGSAAPVGCLLGGGADTITPAGSSNCANAPCGAGFYVEFPGSGTCDVCPAGFSCSGDDTKQPCANGAFYCPAGASASLAIPAGHYAVGVIAEAPCPRGSRCVGGAQYVCERGKYASVEGASACARCPPGRHSPLTNSSECHSCAANSFTVSRGASACDDCSTADPLKPFSTVAGECMSLSGPPTAAPTPFDTAAPTAACAAGSFVQPGMFTCTNCSRGKFANSDGASVCDSCEPGRFAGLPGGGATICSRCASGRSASTPRATACKVCGEARYSPVSGSSACAACLVGIPNAAKTECAPDMAAAEYARNKRCSSFEGMSLMSILVSLAFGVGIPCLCIVAMVLAGCIFAFVCEHKRGIHLENVHAASHQLRKAQLEMNRMGKSRGSNIVGHNPLRQQQAVGGGEDAGGGGSSGLHAQRLKVRERLVAAREKACDDREAALRERERVVVRAGAKHEEEVSKAHDALAKREAEIDSSTEAAAKRLTRADSVLESARLRRKGARTPLAEAAWLYKADDGDTHGPFLSAKMVRWWIKGYFADHVKVCRTDEPGKQGVRERERERERERAAFDSARRFLLLTLFSFPFSFIHFRTVDRYC